MRILLAVLATLTLTLPAADGVKATVSASASVDVAPVKMDVIMTLRQKGADIGAANEALKKHREETLAKFKAMGMDISKAHAETPEVAGEKGQNAMQAAMAAAQGRRAKPKRDLDAEFQLKQIVRLPVALTGKDTLSLLLETEPLKRNIMKALPEVLEGDDEEDDGANPWAAMVAGGAKKGALYFEFNAPRSAELEQKATAAALKSAREKALVLAQAAGFKSAEPISINSQDAKDAMGEGMAGYYQMMMGMAAPAAKPSEDVTGDTPALKFKAAITVEFMLK